MLVAAGALYFAIDPILRLWYFAAVRLIVEEAGGHRTDFAGPLDGFSFLATNGCLDS